MIAKGNWVARKKPRNVTDSLVCERSERVRNFDEYDITFIL
jgi:hypothetical protein